MYVTITSVHSCVSANAGRHTPALCVSFRAHQNAGPMDTNEKDDFDLQGRLGCFSLTDLLQTLSFTQKTGNLTLIQGWNTRTICYELGRITYIAAATRLPTVVELLMGTGRLTVSQLEHKLGKDWKSKLGIISPTHLEPDSEAATPV